MKGIGDDVSFGCLCGHDLVLYSRLEKVVAFLISRGLVDAAPGLLVTRLTRGRERSLSPPNPPRRSITQVPFWWLLKMTIIWLAHRVR